MDITNITGLQNSSTAETITDFGKLDNETKELIRAAVVVRQRAYCPYSHFKVGAAFRAKDSERIFSGCNVESSSFTPTSCAERTALSKAVSEGCLEFSAGAVVAFQEECLTTPCGVCRQFIIEFSKEDLSIFIMRDRTNGVGEIDEKEPVLCTSAFNLLPHGFRSY